MSFPFIPSHFDSSLSTLYDATVGSNAACRSSASPFLLFPHSQSSQACSKRLDNHLLAGIRGESVRSTRESRYLGVLRIIS